MSINRFWGKTAPQSESGYAIHPFPLHSLDAVALANAWLTLDPALLKGLAHQAHCSSSELLPWILFFVGMHDFGKLDARFQIKAPAVAAYLNPPSIPDNIVTTQRFLHGPAGYALFCRESTRYGIAPSHARVFGAWMREVAAHHGSYSSRSSDRDYEAYAVPELVMLDHKARCEWIHTLESLFLTPAGLGLKTCPPQAPRGMAGFCCIADWIASASWMPSSERPTPLVTNGASLRDYYEEEAAEDGPAFSALLKSGLLPHKQLGAGMSALFPSRTPRSVQEGVDAWPVEPGLTIIEAPTGSGKTEAALAYASRLIAARLAEGIIFALPTQATANAMLERLEDMAPRLFEAGANVVLAHGKARSQPLFRQLIRRGTALHTTDAEDGRAQCSEWLAQSRKRALLGQIGVCTIDQVLLAVLPVRHHFVRQFGVQKSVLIVDEAHAYDNYMNGLLDTVLCEHAAAGGSAIILSATLPARRRAELLRDHTDNPLPSENAYPLVTTATRSAITRRSSVHDPEPREIALRPIRAPDVLPDEALLLEMKAAARDGRRLAVVCNLVADAQRIARSLAKGDNDFAIDVFHSRFRFRDRAAEEADVMKDYGPSRAGSLPGRILVATQVVEQSLDLDFDWLITQLCPADLLFQRIGRLHRHPRPGREMPECVVLLPEHNSFGSHLYVYPDPRILWRTLQKVANASHVTFPLAYRDWIESVYDESPWPDEPEEIRSGHAEFMAEEKARRYKAAALTRARYHANTFRDSEADARAMTRDGEMSGALIPMLRLEGRRCTIDGLCLDDMPRHAFLEALDLEAIPVPANWIRSGGFTREEEGAFSLNMELASPGVWTAVAGQWTFTYTKELGLERART